MTEDSKPHSEHGAVLFLARETLRYHEDGMLAAEGIDEPNEVTLAREVVRLFEQLKSLQWNFDSKVDEIRSLEEQLEAAQTEAELKRIETHHANAKRQSIEEQLDVLRETLEEIAGEQDEPDVSPAWYRERALEALVSVGAVRYPASIPLDIGATTTGRLADYCNWGTVCRLPVGHDGPHEYPASEPEGT